ncbi:helix-turn-helix transcriptional regulator [Leptotrichia trevisanii]|uniref:helix-turn-helix domain-containing protein n=1 Tax=Leptotrichia trevisanii TaxID=109328 RepID=UPI0026EDE475|nr:helix-turn-helix transcriptional regulator [Leptotrichia trevisanii]
MKSLDFEIAVKTALLKRGMKNQHLAKSVGVSESYLSDILKGNRKAEPHRKRICEILDLDYENFII